MEKNNYKVYDIRHLTERLKRVRYIEIEVLFQDYIIEYFLDDTLVFEITGPKDWVDEKQKQFEDDYFSNVKYRIASFELFSQGKIRSETYRLGINENAEEIFRKLINWFNITGGNNDGSFRKFKQVTFNKVVTNQEFMEDEFNKSKRLATKIDYLNIDLSNIPLIMEFQGTGE